MVLNCKLYKRRNFDLRHFNSKGHVGSYYSTAISYFSLYEVPTCNVTKTICSLV